ncbi:MAG: sugar O-acetyltransferase [Methanobrevibacter sp.]|uniref:sugar O-acetyltransferase n=1 Tax=Methanobrevibacter sp. TaxID=66852 RepID=UPI0026DEE9DD|nr:sugar O-acetyltransferase [Methanobrevibacter sp.]MDO5849410.1 sugar O-acetyltransferase [Methanobrevibacter sp.]
MKYDDEELILGPLSDLGLPSDDDWQRTSELVYELNHTPPSQKERIAAIIDELFGEFGEDSQILLPVSCNLGYNIKIGKGVFINVDAVFLDPDVIEIGDYTMFGPGVHVYTANHPVRTDDRIVMGEDGKYTFTNFTRPVKIGRKCWIGGRSTILPGVTIGNNVVIGTGSLVNKDIPDNSIAVGSPARIIGRTDE